MSDLTRASTLPSSWYLDPSWLEKEREAVFFRTWQWVGRAADVAEPGDVLTCELLGEPLVIVRSKGGELRAFYNVCRHRAGPVATGCGNHKMLQCAYHGWTYALDGRLHRAPEMEGVEDFDPSRVALEPVAVASWGPFVFVNLERSPQLSFDAYLGPIEDEVRAVGFPLEAMPLVERREYEVECNWKVYIDNYLEGYHIPLVHPALYREVDYERYRVEPRGHFSKQLAPLREGKEDRSYPSEGGQEALYYWVFPNLMLNFYPGNLQMNLVLPLGHDRTLTIFEWYGEGEGEGALEEAIAFSDQVQKEDMAICAAVQKGIRSRSYDAGRLSVRRENGVFHFHELLRSHLRRV